MKTKIVTAALALITLSVNALAFGNENPSALKNLPVEGKFQKIAVGTNIKLVLVPANELFLIKFLLFMVYMFGTEQYLI